MERLLPANPRGSNLISHERIMATAPRWKVSDLSPRNSRLIRCRGREVEPSRSLPFLDMMFIVDDNEDGKRSRRSLETREKVKLLWDDILA